MLPTGSIIVMATLDQQEREPDAGLMARRLWDERVREQKPSFTVTF